jgi:hypothetical protein
MRIRPYSRAFDAYSDARRSSLSRTHLWRIFQGESFREHSGARECSNDGQVTTVGSSEVFVIALSPPITKGGKTIGEIEHVKDLVTTH